MELSPSIAEDAKAADATSPAAPTEAQTRTSLKAAKLKRTASQLLEQLNRAMDESEGAA